MIDHLKTVYKYSLECRSAASLGDGGAITVWSILKGMVDGPQAVVPQGMADGSQTDSQPRMSYQVVDTAYQPIQEEVQRECLSHGIDYSMTITPNHLNANLNQTDLLFINSMHVYGQIKRELGKYHEFVAKYIVIHNTDVDGQYGEARRCNWTVKHLVQRRGYEARDFIVGIVPAIEEFLATHSEWSVDLNHSNCYGLMVLRRDQSGSLASG